MQYQWFMNYAIAFLLAVFSLSSAMAADLFKLSTEAISLSKKDFADTIKVRVIDEEEWAETFREEHEVDEKHAHPYAFVNLERRKSVLQ